MGILGTIKALGPVGAASYAVLRFADRLPGVSYHRYRLIAVPRSGMPAMPRGFETVELSSDRLARHAADLDLPASAAAFRFGQGMACIGVMRHGNLIGVNWLTDGAFEEDEVCVRFHPPRGWAWDTGLYLLPEHRGGRGFAALWAASAAWLARHDLQGSASRIADYNVASWRSHLRMGGARLGALTVVTVGNRQLASRGRPHRSRLGAGPMTEVRL